MFETPHDDRIMIRKVKKSILSFTVANELDRELPRYGMYWVQSDKVVACSGYMMWQAHGVLHLRVTCWSYFEENNLES